MDSEVGITLPQNTVDFIVVCEMKVSWERIVDDSLSPKIHPEDLAVCAKMLKSIDQVVRYYSTAQDYKEWVNIRADTALIAQPDRA